MECLRLERYDENHTPVYVPKIQYNTLDEAIKVAKQVNSQDRIIHKVVSYKCNVCHKYHIGRNGKELTEKQRNKFKTYIKQNGIPTHRESLQKSDNSLI